MRQCEKLVNIVSQEARKQANLDITIIISEVKKTSSQSVILTQDLLH